MAEWHFVETLALGLLEVREREDGYRGVFACKDIAPGTELIRGTAYEYILFDGTRFAHIPEDQHEQFSLVVMMCTLLKRRAEERQRAQEKGKGKEPEGELETDFDRLVFKRLFPPSLEAFSPSDHLVELIESVCLRIPPQLAGDLIQEELAQLCAQILLNSHTIGTKDVQQMGWGLFPGLTNVNHSCWPNAVYYTTSADEPETLVMRAIESIPAGSEVFICYADPAEPKSVRLDHLREKYCFDCQCVRCAFSYDAAREIGTPIPDYAKPDRLNQAILCERCQGPCNLTDGSLESGCPVFRCDVCSHQPPSEPIMERLTHLSELYGTADILYSSGDVEQCAETFNEFSELAAGFLHPCHYWLLNAAQSLATAELDHGNSLAAAAHLTKVAEAKSRLLPPHSPQLSTVYRLLRKIYTDHGLGVEGAANLPEGFIPLDTLNKAIAETAAIARGDAHYFD